MVLFVTGLTLVGCNKTPDHDTNGIREAIEPLASSGVLPFEIEEVNVLGARPEGATQFTYDVEVKGKYRRDRYGDLDVALLVGLSAQHSLEALRPIMPAKYAEIQKVFAQAAPGDRVRALVCRAGEPCALKGSVSSTKTGDKWLHQHMDLAAVPGTRGEGLRFRTSNGKWNGKPTYESADQRSDTFRRLLFQYLGGSEARLVDEVPAGVSIYDVYDPALEAQLRSIHAAGREIDRSIQQVEDVRQRYAVGENRTFRRLGESTWSFSYNAEGTARTLCMESRIDDRREGFAMIYESDYPPHRQAYTLKPQSRSGAFIEVEGVKVERTCCEGAAAGTDIESLLGTEKLDEHISDRSTAFRIIAGANQNLAIEINGVEYPLRESQHRNMLRLTESPQHALFKEIAVGDTWEGTVTDASGKSRAVRAYLATPFYPDGILLMEFGADAQFGFLVHDPLTNRNGWFAFFETIHQFRLGDFADELEHATHGIRIELPQKHLIGYSVAGKYKYDLRPVEKVKPPSWRPILESISGKELPAVLSQGEKRTDVLVQFDAPPESKFTVRISDARDPSRTSSYSGFAYTPSRYGREPAKGDVQLAGKETRPISSATVFRMQMSIDGKSIYASLWGEKGYEGLVIRLP